MRDPPLPHHAVSKKSRCRLRLSVSPAATWPITEQQDRALGHPLSTRIWVLTDSCGSQQSTFSLRTHLTPTPEKERKEWTCVALYVPWGRGPEEEEKKQVWVCGWEKARQVGGGGWGDHKPRLTTLPRKNFNFIMCSLSFHGKLDAEMSFWKELCSSFKFTMSPPFVAHFNPLFHLFSHLKS